MLEETEKHREKYARSVEWIFVTLLEIWSYFELIFHFKKIQVLGSSVSIMAE